MPLYDPLTFHQQLMSEHRSRVNACPHDRSMAYRWSYEMQVWPAALQPPVLALVDGSVAHRWSHEMQVGWEHCCISLLFSLEACRWSYEMQVRPAAFNRPVHQFTGCGGRLCGVPPELRMQMLHVPGSMPPAAFLLCAAALWLVL